MKRGVSTGVLAIAVISVVMMFVATNAQADSFDIWSCHSGAVNESAFSEYWQSSGGFDYDHPVNECPDGWIFPNERTIAQGNRSMIWYTPNSFVTTVRSVTFRYSGGDSQYAYWFGKCGDTCNDLTPLEPIPSGVPDTLPAQLVVDTEPDDVAKFAIWAECLADPCEPGVPFRVNNFEIEMLDDEGPTIENLETVPAGLLDTSEVHWLRGDSFRLKFTATDLRTGVMGAGVGIAGNPVDVGPVGWCYEYTDGPFTRAQFCDHVLVFDRSIDATSLADGEHELGIVAFDGRNNLTFSVDHTLRTDNGEPDPPSGLKLLGEATPAGWTSQPQIEFEVDDPTQNPVNTEFSGWRDVRYRLRSLDGLGATPTELSEVPTGPRSITIPAEGRWDLGVWLADGAGNEGDKSSEFVGFDRDAPEAPQLAPNGWITFDELIDGHDQIWDAPDEDPELESGVCGYSVEFDDELNGVPDETIDVKSTHAQAPARLRGGYHFAHVRTVACNGLASTVATEPLNVDGGQPNPQIGGWVGPSWSRTSGSITLFGSDDLSGVRRLHVSHDNGPFEETEGPTTTIAPEEGEHVVAWKTEDVAGNVSDTEEVTIRRDWTAPNVEFEPRDLNNPGAIVAKVTDVASGPASALILYHRIDAAPGSPESAWRSLGATELSEPANGGTLTVSRSLPDEQMSAGLYEFRVIATDHAGNTTEDAATPTSLLLSLPLREQLVLTSAVADVEMRCTTAAGRRCRSLASCRKSQRCTNKPMVIRERASAERERRFGARSALTGALVDSTGNPVAGRQLQVLHRVEFGPLQPLASVTTDADGAYSLLLDDLPTRDFIVRFAGDQLSKPTESSASLAVRAALTLTVKPRRVRSGRPFTLRGRLLSGNLGLPDGKKVIEFQFLRGSRWVSVLQGARTNSKGEFRGTWPGVSANKATTIYFRAAAKSDAMWPFLTGFSRRVPVRVLP